MLLLWEYMIVGKYAEAWASQVYDMGCFNFLLIINSLKIQGSIAICNSKIMSKLLDKFGSKIFPSAEMLLPSPSNFAPLMSLKSPKSFSLKYVV